MLPSEPEERRRVRRLIVGKENVSHDPIGVERPQAATRVPRPLRSLGDLGVRQPLALVALRQRLLDFGCLRLGRHPQRDVLGEPVIEVGPVLRIDVRTICFDRRTDVTVRGDDHHATRTVFVDHACSLRRPPTSQLR